MVKEIFMQFEITTPVYSKSAHGIITSIIFNVARQLSLKP